MPSNSHERAGWQAGAVRYAFAVAAVLAATTAHWWLATLFGPLSPLVPFYAASLLTLVFTGPAPAAIATLLSAGAAMLLSMVLPAPIPSPGTVALLIDIGVFVIVNFALCAWAHQQHWAHGISGHRQRSQMQRMLDQVHAEICERTRAEAALREADRRKNLFLATLSHELRNPLAPIRAAARLLESASASSEQVQRCQAIISRQVGHMAALLDDLLDVSRLTRGELTLKRAAVPLGSLLDAAIETAQPLLMAREHELRLELAAGSPIVEVDPVRFTQIITNLLTNAAKYTQPGGTITIGTHLDADALGVFVRDSGAGLAPEMLDEVFEMFVRLDASAENTDTGLGIGLALVKALVELHGGRVRAHSPGPGRGSTFSLNLPRDLVVGTAQAAVGPPAQLPAPAAARRVLVADDNVDAAESLAMLLCQAGHEVAIAHDGPQTLDLAERMRPHVVLLDIGMPQLSGYEVARQLRETPWGSTMLLVAVTGWGQDEDKRSADAAGFDHHLTKPADPTQLEAILAAPLPEPARRTG